jgi:hypothetical protein
MSIEDNKTVVGRWFTEFWEPDFNVRVIDELAAPDIRFEYSLHEPLRGRDQVREFALRFRRRPRILASARRPISSPRAITSLGGGRAAGPTPAPRSTISRSGRCRRDPARRCSSPARP